MTSHDIPEAAVEAAWDNLLERGRTGPIDYAELKAALEAAAPHMLSHERQQTADAHRDAMVNRETKRAELAAAWEDGHLMGWNEATANSLPERESLWRNPYRPAK